MLEQEKNMSEQQNDMGKRICLNSKMICRYK